MNAIFDAIMSSLCKETPLLEVGMWKYSSNYLSLVEEGKHVQNIVKQSYINK